MLFASLGALWFLGIWCSPFTGWLIENLEENYRTFGEDIISKDVDTLYIMALGAGHCCDPALPPNQQLSNSELQRSIEAVRIYHLLKQSKAKVVFIGSGRQSANSSCSQASAITRTALLLGVAPADTAMLIHTTDTETEAKGFAQRFGTHHPVIVVTHAHHLPRALAWFKAEGLRAIPAPAHFYSRRDPADQRWWKAWYFDPNNVNQWRHWVHEQLGMVELFIETRGEKREEDYRLWTG